jgi:predicted nuclease of restriction endonuclease-like RecB superfamily
LLTADLVTTRRRGDRLMIVPLAEQDRGRARELAGAYLELARAHVGLPRGALLEASRAVAVAAREQKLGRGLWKLVLDRCHFEEGTGIEPAPLRQELFLAAAAARRREDTRDGFDRAALVAEAAARRQVAVAEIEAALYADLTEAHLMRHFDPVSAEDLVASYDLAQVQAVLLRAVKVTATVRATPAHHRYLFRRLKFLRLLHRVHRLPDRRGGLPGGYAIEIDGPYALFDAVTKYGLQLALVFPALAACSEWAISADLRWGREARPLRLELRGETPAALPTPEEELPGEVMALLAQLREGGSPWRPAVSGALLDLPGAGLCIPDLELTHATTGQTVYLEVLGFWSRDAVWRRIELVERGLPYPVVFAVSKHLRVSEQALGDEHPAALYVYSRTMNARAVLEKVEAAAQAPRRLPISQ